MIKRIDMPMAGTRGARWAAGLAALALCMTTAMAASSDWWIDIANDRADAVKTTLAEGENPNAPSPDGQPPLMLAIRDGSWKVYDLLLAHRRIDVNAENRNHETPLMYLAIVGDVKRAQALIKLGAHVNRLGWTPLHYAASKGNEDMVDLLLANKAIVNAPAPDGTTPLMMAAFSGSEEVVRTLLNAGADATTLNLKKQSAADWARLRNHESLAAKLDQLSARVLAGRAAMRARNRAAAAAAGSGQSEDDADARDANDSSGAAVPGDGSAAGRESSVPGQGASPVPPGPDSVKAVDIRPPAPAPSLEPAKAPAAKPDASQGNSTSRYFDLDRFDDDQAR